MRVKGHDRQRERLEQKKRLAAALMDQVHNDRFLLLEHIPGNVQRPDRRWFCINIWIFICSAFSGGWSKISGSGHFYETEIIKNIYVCALLTAIAWLIIVVSAYSMMG